MPKRRGRQRDNIQQDEGLVWVTNALFVLLAGVLQVVYAVVCILAKLVCCLFKRNEDSPETRKP